ncbi:hypothetical protein A2U01_0018547 [Trifolium medium]|uniref:Uncharacterized protein n=1 Tax=Trifolium medium TaxID=97028 RepID=A0A392NCW7_9FABA|nr:hypothetical protein [Trifolium medium]
MKRRKKNQLEVIKRWFSSRPMVVVLDEGSEEEEDRWDEYWKGCESNYIAREEERGHMTKDHPKATYPP